MKEIVVISGKGGTGKTSITASMAVLGGNNVVVADCDVDASNMHLLLDPYFVEKEDFYSGETAIIKKNDCTKCGSCFDVCRFDAIDIIDGNYIVNELNCEGCGYCARVCNAQAIINKSCHVGSWYISNICTGSIMVHAKLGIGADNSGKLVAKVKNEAKHIAEEEFKDYVIVDGSPGVGCPVVSSISGASYVVIVTEPTVSGVHDLKRVYELVKKFNIPAGCIINKFDINIENTNSILSYLKSENITHLSNIPYDEVFIEAAVSGQSIVEYEGNAVIVELINNSWNKIKEIVKK